MNQLFHPLSSSRSPRSRGAAVVSPDVERLADEVRGKGWISFSARSEQGDWNLFSCGARRLVASCPHADAGVGMRPHRNSRATGQRPLCQLAQTAPRRLKNTATANRRSPDGELNADGTGEGALARRANLPWASWSPDAARRLRVSPAVKASRSWMSRRKKSAYLPRQGFFNAHAGHPMAGESAAWRILRHRLGSTARLNAAIR
jgi:hypothetical protein